MQHLHTYRLQTSSQLSIATTTSTHAKIKPTISTSARCDETYWPGIRYGDLWGSRILDNFKPPAREGLGTTRAPTEIFLLPSLAGFGLCDFSRCVDDGAGCVGGGFWTSAKSSAVVRGRSASNTMDGLDSSLVDDDDDEVDFLLTSTCWTSSNNVAILWPGRKAVFPATKVTVWESGAARARGARQSEPRM